MLSNTLEKALNEHIQQEFYSSYLYLAMASYCESINLGGFAHWLRAQSQEEWSHGMKFFEHVQHRGGRVRLQALDQPPSDFGSPLEMFKQVLEHERQVTAMIHKLYEQALKENDYPAQVMLQWFVSEQVEEEKSAHDIIEQLKLIGDQGTALLMLDRQLGARE
ncbi:MAG: ferritin [bacterium]